MLTTTAEMVLPTALVGSIPRPSWYTRSLGGGDFKMAMSDRGFREQYIDAVGAYVNDQECAGLDILVDGDARFDNDVGGRGWFFYPLDRLAGLEGRSDVIDIWVDHYRPGHIFWELMEAYQTRVLTGKVGPGLLHYAAIWQTAQKLTDRPMKFGAIAVEPVFYMIQDRRVAYDSSEELLFDLADIFNAEYRALAAAGCPIIQIEEPMFHITVPEDLIEEKVLIEVFNRSVAGVETEIWCHTCWGNPAQQSIRDEDTTYESALEGLFAVDADVLTFECASTGGKDLAAIGRIASDKKVAIGAVNHVKTQVETPEEVAGLLRKALEHIPVERLIVTTDCGFGREGLSRRIAFYKMVALVEGTNLVRRELGLPEAEVRASDPRFAFSFAG